MLKSFIHEAPGIIKCAFPVDTPNTDISLKGLEHILLYGKIPSTNSEEASALGQRQVVA